MTALIDVLYDLYEKTGPAKFDPVTKKPDVDVQTGLRSQDPSKQVPVCDTVPEQTTVLHEHVQDTLTEPVSDHTVAFDDMKESRWDPDIRDWVKVILGGAIAYPVPSPTETAATARLHLAVRTKNAVGQTPPARPAPAGKSPADK